MKEAGKRVLVGFLELDKVLHKAHSLLQLTCLPNDLHGMVQIYLVGASDLVQSEHAAVKRRLDVRCRHSLVPVVTWEAIGQQLEFLCGETLCRACSFLHNLLVYMLVFGTLVVRKNVLQRSGMYMRLVLTNMRLVVRPLTVASSQPHLMLRFRICSTVPAGSAFAGGGALLTDRGGRSAGQHSLCPTE